MTCKVQLKPWDRADTSDVKDIFTVVVMYKKDKEGKTIKERHILKDSVNDIFLAEVNGNLPYRIVILATAGKGKTTVVAKLAHDWAYQEHGSPLKDLPLLFILKLRNVDRGTSLGQAIKTELLSDIPDLDPNALERFISRNQKHCHIILDGLDEFNGSLRSSPSSSNVCAVMSNKDLKECRVLVTTRPHLEDEFNQGDLPVVYAKMEIEGFSKAQSKSYIQKFFSQDRVNGEKLLKHLEQHDIIQELVGTPLFCLMVCHLWQEDLIKDITTQTELLDTVNVFLYHHAMARRDLKISSKEFRGLLQSLGKVALSGLLAENAKLVFTPDDFVNIPHELEQGCRLGIVFETKQPKRHVALEGPTKDVTIEFYHRMAQEHCAAKYLSKQTRYSKATEMLTTLASSQPLRNLHRSACQRTVTKALADIETRFPAYLDLLRFTAGSSEPACLRVMEMILQNPNLETAEKYRLLLDCSSESAHLKGEISLMVQGCVRGNRVTISSPTAYTSVGLKKLPLGVKEMVRNINNCV